MTTEKTPFEKIDLVLKYICNADRPPFRTDGEIYKDNGFDNNSKELIEILLKLERDKYVHTEINSQNIKQYYSTFDGRLFLVKGAYRQQQLDEEQKRVDLKRLESITNRNNEILTFGTIFGSLVALGLLIIEIIKYCSCSCDN